LLTPNHKIHRLFQHNDYNYRKGIVGCALSHIFMWYELVNSSNLNGMLICEDDAELSPNFTNKFIHLLTSTPDAGIIFLGHHPYPAYKKTSDYDRSIFPIAEKWSKEKSITESMGGTTAYYISKTAAGSLLDWIDDNSVKHGIDWVMFEAEIPQGVYYSRPFIAFADCVQSNGTVDSDIQKVYDGCGYKDMKELLADELSYWGETGVVNKFSNMPCNEDSCSKITCYSGDPVKKDILSGKALWISSPSLLRNIALYPVSWYTIEIQGEKEAYVFTIPDNQVSEKNLNERTFSGFLNRRNPKL